MMEPYLQLEKEWAEFNGYHPEQMVACSSGTAALHLALEALKLPQGSEVLVPDFTMVACARAVTLAGLVPVFVDCDERLLMDLRNIFGQGVGKGDPDKPTGSAVMAVHIYGRRCDMNNIAGFARMCGLKVIEDLAEAHGVRPHPDTNAACWSFYKNKIVAGEEGGAVAFKDPAHAKLARQLRSLGFTDAHDFTHTPRGHNYRMSNLHAGAILGERRIGFCSLDNYGWCATKRREIEAWYESYCPQQWKMPRRDAVWVYDLILPWKGDFGDGYGFVNLAVSRLREVGIEARHAFKPMHELQEYRNCRFVQRQESNITPYPMSSMMSQRVIYLPVQPGITTQAQCNLAFDILDNLIDSH